MNLKYKTVVLISDEELRNFVIDVLTHTKYDITVKVISSKSEINDDLMKDTSIFITDLLCFPTCDKVSKFKVPVLVMVNEEEPDDGIGDFPLESIDKLSICDMIRKPFYPSLLINKVRLLVRLAEANRLLHLDKSNILSNLWNMLNYTNFYLIITDENHKVVLGNYKLATALGLKDEHEIVGCNWLDFIPEHDLAGVELEFQLIRKESKVSSEMTFDLRESNGINTVKWFNSFINSTNNWIFSIGVPVTKEIDFNDNVGSLRAYWKDIIEKDRVMIDTLRDTFSKQASKVV